MTSTLSIPAKTSKSIVVALPEWYVDASERTRTEMHTFVWAVEKAGIDWSSEFAMEFMRRFNLTPSQFADMVQLFRSASTVDDRSAPRCDKCNFTALDEDGTLVRCSGTDCTKHRHQICGAYDGFKCEECIAADDDRTASCRPVPRSKPWRPCDDDGLVVGWCFLWKGRRCVWTVVVDEMVVVRR